MRDDANAVDDGGDDDGNALLYETVSSSKYNSS